MSFSRSDAITAPFKRMFSKKRESSALSHSADSFFRLCVGLSAGGALSASSSNACGVEKGTAFGPIEWREFSGGSSEGNDFPPEVTPVTEGDETEGCTCMVGAAAAVGCCGGGVGVRVLANVTKGTLTLGCTGVEELFGAAVLDGLEISEKFPLDARITFTPV